jgi:TonB family protein
MTYHKNTVLIFAAILLANVAWCATKDDAPSPEALISRARMQEEVWIEGTPPMMMRAELQVYDAKGNPVHGDYALYWVSPSRWREVIRFGDYERLRVRDSRGYWQKSGLSYEPELIFRLDKMLHLKDAFKLRTNQTLGKVKNRKENGVAEQCTEVRWPNSADRTMCFDKPSGALVSTEYPAGELQTPLDLSRIEYGAFTPVAGKLVPFEIRALNDRKVITSIKVLEISQITKEDPALFNEPANAEFWAQCDDMQDAYVVNQVMPRYPISARPRAASGTVVLYAVIETDGSLSHIAVIQTVTADLDDAAIDGVRHWRYKPATCGQTPIRVETSIPVGFWIGTLR